MSHSFSPEKTKRLGIRVLANCSGFSLTQQHHKNECDIDRIITRYARTGELPPGKQHGTFGDVTHLQGDITERLEHARTTISQAQTDLSNHKQKLLSEKQQKLLLQQQQKQKLQQQKQEVEDLKTRLSELEGPPS